MQKVIMLISEIGLCYGMLILFEWLFLEIYTLLPFKNCGRCAFNKLAKDYALSNESEELIEENLMLS